MKIGFCVVNYSELPVEEVCRIAADNGYDAVELPAYTDNGQVDVEELLKGGKAKAFPPKIQTVFCLKVAQTVSVQVVA